MNDLCKVPQHMKDGAIGAGCMEEKSFLSLLPLQSRNNPQVVGYCSLPSISSMANGDWQDYSHGHTSSDSGFYETTGPSCLIILGPAACELSWRSGCSGEADGCQGCGSALLLHSWSLHGSLGLCSWLAGDLAQQIMAKYYACALRTIPEHREKA